MSSNFPVTLVQHCVQNAPPKLVKESPAGYNLGKTAETFYHCNIYRIWGKRIRFD